MAVGKLCFLMFSALLAAHFIIAEESQDHNGDSNNRWWGSIGIHRTADASGEERRAPRRPVSFLPSMAGCNVNAEPGWSCADCRTVKVCAPNNISISFSCGLFQPYCDGGECKSSASPSCNTANASE